MFYTNLIILIHIILWFSNITKKNTKHKRNTKNSSDSIVIRDWVPCWTTRIK